MPKLLDNRLIGPDMDVANRVLYGATAGWALVVNEDGKSMILAEKAGPTGPTGPLGPTGTVGPQSLFAETAKESYSNDSGVSIQQWLCTKWFDITPVGMFTAIADIAYGRGFFVAVGRNGSTPVIAYASVQSSTTTWIKVDAVDIGFSNNTLVLGVTYANGVFMACGSNGEIAYSSVGNVWEILRQGVDTSHLYRIAYGYPHGWIAVGTTGSSLASDGITLRSTDGITWTRLATSALDDDTFSGIPVYSVCSVAGKFIAVGGESGVVTNHIATSVDGITWTIRDTPQPAAAHWRVDYGNGRLVVGTDGTARTPPYGSSLLGSNNGISWYESSLNLNLGQVTGLSYGNGVFVAGSLSMQVSVDGVNYFNAYTTGWGGPCMNGAYGNGVFVMVSYDGKMIRSGMLNEFVGSTATPPTNSGDYTGGDNTGGGLGGTSSGSSAGNQAGNMMGDGTF